jgi:ABC-type uncharacterized transport system involved in gliding motility auxiliary subunit
MNSAEGRPQVIVAARQEHETTKGLPMLILPVATGLEVQNAEPPPAMPGAPPPPPSKAVALFKTADTAALATVAGAPPRRGPLTVAAAVDETPPKPQQTPGMPPQPEPQDSTRRSRLIVVGDSDFCTDQTIEMLGGPRSYGQFNLAFAVMGINWLVKNEKLVAIPPKEAPEQPFSMTDGQRRFVWSLTIGIVPLLIIVSGTLVWWLRRRS